MSLCALRLYLCCYYLLLVSYKSKALILIDLLVYLFPVDTNYIGCLNLLFGKFVFKLDLTRIVRINFSMKFISDFSVLEVPIQALEVHTGSSDAHIGTSGLY